MNPSHPNFAEFDPLAYIPVTGRRWRGPTLNIPERLRAQLVSELIAGKQAMNQHSPGSDGHTRALHRVLDARRALGEHDDRFDQASGANDASAHAVSAIRALLRSRPRGDMITAHEVESIVAAGGWQRCGEVVSAAVGQLLAAEELVEITAHPGEVRAGRHASTERRFGRGPGFC